MKFSEMMNENYGVTTPVDPSEQQRQDLETMRRLVELQTNLTAHVNVIANSIASLDIIRESLGESSVALFEGAMPAWYEEEVAAVRYSFDSIQIRLTEIGQRLARDYAA